QKKSRSSAARGGEPARYNTAPPHDRRCLAPPRANLGLSSSATMFNQAGALVLIYKDGSVQVNHGGTEMGQGLQTKIRQIAAESLGLPESAIRIMSPRTDKIS